MNERIIIGDESEVRRLLERGSGNIYFDEISPLGNMLFAFESDAEKQWNVTAMQLIESYAKVGLIDRKRWQAAKQPIAFLRRKYESGVFVAKYAAMRMLIEYLNCFNKSNASEIFIDRVSTLCRPFHLYANNKPWRELPDNFLENSSVGFMVS